MHHLSANFWGIDYVFFVCFSVCREELRVRGVNNIDEALKKEFPSWFKKHVSQLNNASEDLKSLADGPDKRVIVHSACNVKGARFRTVSREKNLRTQNCGVMNKAFVAGQQDNVFYGVLQEVLELRYVPNKHGPRSVFLFRCDWFDLESKKSKMKDDGHYKSINTSVLWYKNDPFILAGQAETCFYLEDIEFGLPWKIVQTFTNIKVFDVPENEFGNDATDQENLAYQEDVCQMDPRFQHVFDEGDEENDDVDAVDRPDEVERVAARIVEDLEKEDNNNEDMYISEDEHVYNLEDLENDAADRNSDYDTDIEE